MVNGKISRLYYWIKLMSKISLSPDDTVFIRLVCEYKKYNEAIWVKIDRFNT